MTDALKLPDVRQLSPPGALLTVAEPVVVLLPPELALPVLPPLELPLLEPPVVLR